MKNIVLLISMLLLTNVSAEPLSPEQTINEVISLLKSGKPLEAFEMAFSGNEHMKEKKADMDQLKFGFSGFVSQVGIPYDCELLISKSLKNRYKIVKYLCLSEKQPFEINFDFYRPKNEWRLQAFGYSSEIDEIIEESSRVDLRRLSESNGS